LGCLNEGSEKALDVQLHEALLHGHRREDSERAAGVSHGVTQAFIGVLLRWVRSLDYNLRQKLCEYILPNGEKAGKSSSKGNLAESSDAPNAKRTRPADPNLVGSKNSTGVRQRSQSFGSRIHLPNGEKAGQSSSNGNLAESSDAPNAKQTRPADPNLVGSKNSTGLRRRGNSIGVRIHLPGTREKFWLGTYKTEKAAAQARDAAANWLATHSGTEFLDDEHRNELKKCAKEAGEHLSDDHSHHKVGLAVLVENLEEEATTLASLKGKEVASAEHVIQWESSAQENPFSSSEFEEKATTLASLKRKAVASAEHVSQWESPAQENPISPSEFEEKATTLASLQGQAVASAEHVSQWESPAQENPISSSELVDWVSNLFKL
jgi:hypothetical protein